MERALGTYADVLADSGVEAIYNPPANALHGPWSLAAIQAGKHVLSEKPSPPASPPASRTVLISEAAR